MPRLTSRRRSLRFARLKLRSIELPIYTYRHPQDGREVILIGVIHIAETEYYKLLQHLVAGYEQRGFTVLYEKVAKISDEEHDALAGLEAKIAKVLRRFSHNNEKVGSRLGLVHQMVGLTYFDSWIRTDMSIAEVARFTADRLRRVGVTDIPTHIMDEVERKPPSDEDPLYNNFTRAIAAFPILAIIPYSLGALIRRTKTVGEFQRVILDDRNEHAYRLSRPHIQDGSAVMIWGAAHLPGLDSLLRADGYQRTGCMWVPAIGINR